jgi:hypothetical protein
MLRSRVDARELAAFSRELTRLGKGEAKREMGKRIGKAVQPAAAEARRNIRSSAGGGLRATGLRGRIAKTVTVKRRLSGRNPMVLVFLAGSKMPAHQRGLPAAWEGEKRWRKPLFGDRERWFGQEGSPTFYRTMRRHEPRIERDVASVVDWVRKELRT